MNWRWQLLEMTLRLFAYAGLGILLATALILVASVVPVISK